MQMVQELNRFGQRGLRVGNEGQFDLVGFQPGSILADCQDDLSRGIPLLGEVMDLTIRHFWTPQDRRDDDFIRVVDEQFSCLPISQHGQTDFLRHGHFHDHLG